MNKTIKWLLIIVTVVVIIVISTVLTISSRYDADGNPTWIETTALITDSEQMPNGDYAYTLEYNVTKGTTRNMAGEIIQGIITQNVFGLEQQAIVGQKVKLSYNKDEPILYKLLETVKTKP